jgi:hypothetical protein
MHFYNVLLGIDHAARDTNRRLRVRVKAEDVLSAAIAAEKIGDSRVFEPGVEYTHAMRVVEVRPRTAAAMPMPLPMAA